MAEMPQEKEFSVDWDLQGERNFLPRVDSQKKEIPDRRWFSNRCRPLTLFTEWAIRIHEDLSRTQLLQVPTLGRWGLAESSPVLSLKPGEKKAESRPSPSLQGS